MTETRAGNKHHAEYAILKHLREKHNLAELKEQMVTGNKPRDIEVAENRFNGGCDKILALLDREINRRRSKLPADHPDFKPKEAKA